MLLATIAEDVGVNQVNPRLAKKLHVLAALEVERYRKATLDLTMTRGGGTDIAQATDRADRPRRRRSTRAAWRLLSSWLFNPPPGPDVTQCHRASVGDRADARHAHDARCRRDDQRQLGEGRQGARQRVARRGGVPLLSARAPPGEDEVTVGPRSSW